MTAESQLAGYSTDSYAPQDLLTGEMQVTTDTVTILSGAGVVASRSVLGAVTASGKYILSLAAASDGSEVPTCILVHEVDATAGDVEAQVYLTGCFNPDLLVFGTGHTAANISPKLPNSLQVKALYPAA